jgi:hypothetical protein
METGAPRRFASAPPPARGSQMADNLVHIGETIVNGVLFDPKNTEAWSSMDVEGLYRSAPRLFDLLEERGVEYVLVGGIAMLAYVEGRNTQDIDLIVSAADLAKMPELRIEEQNIEFARAWLGELRVDFLFTRSKIFNAVKKRYVTTKRFIERELPCATVEGLLLLKLYALPSLYRQGRFDKVRIYETDVASLIELAKPSLTPLFDELGKHMLPSDADEIRRIVAEIEDRIAKQSQRFGPTD